MRLDSCVGCFDSGWNPVKNKTCVFNVVCKKMADKLIKAQFDINNDEEEDLKVPSWCPKFGDNVEETKETTRKKTPLEMWDDVTAKIKWEDIEVGKTYHIPPYNSQERSDIVVTTKTGTFLRYNKQCGNTTIFGTIYPNQIAHRLMVEKHEK